VKQQPQPTGKTRSGRKVTLLQVRREFFDFPLYGTIEGYDGPDVWLHNGRWSYDGEDHPNDLTDL